MGQLAVYTAVSYTHLDVYKRQQYSKADIPEHTQYDTQSLAKFAFSMFWRAMRFAEEQQVDVYKRQEIHRQL